MVFVDCEATVKILDEWEAPAELLRAVVRDFKHLDKTGKQCFQRFYSRLFAERDFCLFEIDHALLDLPYVITNLALDTISLRGSRQLRRNAVPETDSQEPVDVPNALDRSNARLDDTTERHEVNFASGSIWLFHKNLQKRNLSKKR